MSRRSQMRMSADRDRRLGGLPGREQHEALAGAVIVVAPRIGRGIGARLRGAAPRSAISRTDSGSGTLIGSARWAMSSSVCARAEQPQVGAERVDPELAAGRVAGVGHQRQPGEPERQQPPQEDADVGNVVAAGRRVPAAASRRCARSRRRRRPAGACAPRRAGRRSPARAAGRGSCTASVASSSKNSTACAGQPVTSRASCFEHQRGALAAAVARSCWRPRRAARRPSATTPCSGR